MELTDLEWRNIVTVLNEIIDGNEVHTAGWMPGSNWMGYTVFHPLLKKKSERTLSLHDNVHSLLAFLISYSLSYAFYRK